MLATDHPRCHFSLWPYQCVEPYPAGDPFLSIPYSHDFSLKIVCFPWVLGFPLLHPLASNSVGCLFPSHPTHYPNTQDLIACPPPHTPKNPHPSRRVVTGPW